MNGRTMFLTFDDGTLRITPLSEPPGLRIGGELDRHGVLAVTTALIAAWSENRPVYLDLGELRFIDAGGLRVIASAAGSGTVRFVAVSDEVRRLLHLIGWSDLVCQCWAQELSPFLSPRFFEGAAINDAASSGGRWISNER